MLRIFAVVLLVVLNTALSLAPSVAQEQKNLSAERLWGMGIRYLPNVLAPMAPADVDPALGAALTVQWWVSNLLALEAGGWVADFSDSWNTRSVSILTGGIALKLADHEVSDLYVSARAISMQGVSKNLCCVILEPPREPQPENGVVRWPPSSESQTSTLAVEAALGFEWSFSAQLALGFEMGAIYAQMTTTNYPGPKPADQPTPEQMPQPETRASSSFGIILHLSLHFYLPGAKQ